MRRRAEGVMEHANSLKLHCMMKLFTRKKYVCALLSLCMWIWIRKRVLISLHGDLRLKLIIVWVSCDRHSILVLSHVLIHFFQFVE